jgi:uncharacterized membrane protein
MMKKTKIQPLNDEHLDEIFDRDLTFGEKISDAVADFVGSWKYIIFQSVFLAIWITVNIIAVMHGFGGFIFIAFDKPPFILLNLILSFLAAFQAPLILMSGNRTSAKDRARDELQFGITADIRTELYEIRQQIGPKKPKKTK